jgi:hypothetical protein
LGKDDEIGLGHRCRRVGGGWVVKADEGACCCVMLSDLGAWACSGEDG